MNAKTLKALRGSIAKWQAIVDGTGEDNYWKNCPLCRLFNNDEDQRFDHECVGCPVRDKTGVSGCSNTPYTNWSELTLNQKFGGPRRVETPEQKAAAQAELNFLKSLLPEGKS